MTETKFDKQRLYDLRDGVEDIGPIVDGINDGKIIPENEAIPYLIQAITMNIPAPCGQGDYGAAIKRLQEMWVPPDKQ